MSKEKSLEVCVISSEAVPYAKSGGLADVAGALPRALADLGCRCSLIVPCYQGVRERYSLFTPVLSGLKISLDREDTRVDIVEHHPAPGTTTYLVREDNLFDRPHLYGTPDGDYADNARRFSIFCRAALAATERLGLLPDLFHVHDWQAALVPLYLRHCPELAPTLRGVPSLLTIHNLAFQGLFPRTVLEASGIPGRLFHPRGVEFYGQVNFLKAGILYADAVSTVSRKYSREILTPEYGCGLEGVLRERAGVLHGVLNGADYATWNPGTDPHIAARYSSRKFAAGKKKCKEDLLRAFGLGTNLDTPLLGTISRLTDQKGFDLIFAAMPALMKLGLRFVLLGTGERKYQEMFSDLAKRYPDQIGVRIAYDEVLAHKIEAGADFFLLPSRFEPCGLNQIYSLKYGTIPIVRATGGLDDTITNFSPASGRGNGFKFTPYTPEALVARVRSALWLYRYPRQMRRLRENAMAEDFSWERAARRYLRLYRRIIASSQNGGRLGEGRMPEGEDT